MSAKRNAWGMRQVDIFGFFQEGMEHSVPWLEPFKGMLRWVI